MGVATANDDRNINLEILTNVFDFGCDLMQDTIVKSKTSRFGQSLARQFQHDPLPCGTVGLTG
jgi:hypothetical protein